MFTQYRLKACIACIPATLVLGACYDGPTDDQTQLSGLPGAGTGGDGSGGLSNSGNGGSGGAATSSAGGDNGVTRGDSAGSSGSASSDGGVPDAPVPAEGLSLTVVEANQGVAIRLADDGQLIEPEERKAELIHGRTTLVRAHWELEEGWQDREIEARLSLIAPDGTTEELSDIRRIDGDINERELDGTFHWILRPESVLPDMRYSVALYEVDVQSTGTPVVNPPRIPADGDAEFGITGDPMEIKVVVIPVMNSSGEGVIVTPENQARFESAVLSEYPVQTVNVTWREPMVVNGVLTDSNQGWNAMEDAREEDNASPNTYYHILLDRNTCCADNGEFSWGGIGGVAGDEPSAANWGGRDAMSKVNGDDQWGTGVIIHELGHNHGRPHAPCGGPNGPDPQYPSEDPYGPEAGIGVQGYHIDDQELINPFPNDPPQGNWDRPYKDNMSYCSPSWWSDYNWQLNIERTRLLTSWDNEKVLTPTLGIRGIVSEDGSTSWSVVKVFEDTNAAAAPTSARRASLKRAGQPAAQTGVTVIPISEGRGSFIGIVPSQEQLDFDELMVQVDGREFSVKRESIRGIERFSRP